MDLSDQTLTDTNPPYNTFQLKRWCYKLPFLHVFWSAFNLKPSLHKHEKSPPFFSHWCWHPPLASLSQGCSEMIRIPKNEVFRTVEGISISNWKLKKKGLTFTASLLVLAKFEIFHTWTEVLVPLFVTYLGAYLMVLQITRMN